MLVLDEERVVIEASDHQTIKFYKSLGMECIPCPFKHVKSIGGSFYCATVDLVRETISQ
jgi:glycine amidinotransferase